MGQDDQAGAQNPPGQTGQVGQGGQSGQPGQGSQSGQSGQGGQVGQVGQGAPQPSPGQVGPVGPVDPWVVSRRRLADERLAKAILGTLVYLEDTQIRDRPGKGNPLWDATDAGDGADNRMLLNLPFKESLPLPAPPMLHVRNRIGEWASTVHFLPKRTGFGGRTFVSVQDSNVFMTTFIAYPLFLFDDAALPGKRQFLRPMLELARENVKSFHRDGSFNFWATLPGVMSKSTRTGPFNIPPEMIEKLGQAYLNPKFAKFFALLTRGLKAPPAYWVEQCLNRKVNPSGADGLFNIPNDADDTATGVAFQNLLARFFPEMGETPDLGALEICSRFRDVGRAREDGRDQWKGKDSGAFLTWLKDESQPIFDTPETGIIPLGVNNVDAVVNSNVVFSLALNGQKRLPGYREALALCAAAITRHAWPDAGLYYPQYMIFPYTVSRAWRDGGAREEPLASAIPVLLKNLLDEQEAWGSKGFGRRGSFPGGEDRAIHLSTALGLVTLLNIGRDTAQDAGLLARYDRGVVDAVCYLVREGKERRVRNESTRAVFPDRDLERQTWDSGLFFSASFWDLGHWRSEAFTVAMAAEALAKYALAYDCDRAGFAARRLRLVDDPAAKLGMRLEAR